jgi:SEC-C motif domain protein
MLFRVIRLVFMFLQPLCPCGSDVPFLRCCEPYLAGTAIAPTAEALMRSRYTAYSTGNADYLMTTLHPKSHQKNERLTLLESIQNTRWIGLTIIKTQKGQIHDKRGIVEFLALYQPTRSKDLLQTDIANQLHERSRFSKEGDQWFYVDGDILLPMKNMSWRSP